MAYLKLQDYDGISTVSRARTSNVSTIIVDSAHGLITGDTVTISGLSGSDYNDDDVSATVTNSVTFTYANTGDNEGTTGDTGGLIFANYTFPYNPNSIEFGTNKFVDQRNLPYSFTFLGFSSSIKSNINIGINGHFDGSTKNSAYRSLVKKINSPIMLRLYFENSHDKFYICTGMTVQKVPTGTRPLHTDYVSNLFSPFGILFDDTQQSGLLDGSDSNDGDITTPIEKITGSVSSGSAVTIKDKNNNGFTFTPDATGTMTYSLIKVLSADNTTYLVNYMYVDIDGTEKIIQNASTSGDLMLKLEPGESLNDIFTGGTITNITPTFYFRNGWASD